MKQLSENDNRNIESRRVVATTSVTEKHPLILSALMASAALGAIAATLWFAGVAQ
jgi:hypothetical protein